MSCEFNEYTDDFCQDSCTPVRSEMLPTFWVDASHATNAKTIQRF